MSCRTCKWLDVKVDKLGRRVTRKNNAYQCTVPIPQITLPTSVTREFGFNWPPRRTLMHSDIWDQVCPMWEKWDKV